MTVFIAHAKADAAAAESLKKTLDLRGLHAELETGERGFRPLGRMDAVVALWSKNSPFDLHRLQFEKRALDAWADGKLIFVKLDPHFAPVGLRDLQFVDAMFEAQRELVAWPEVAKRAAAATRPAPPPAASAPADDAFRGPGGELASEEKAAEAPRSQPEPARRRKESGGGGGAARLAVALLVGVAAAAVVAIVQWRFVGAIDARAALISVGVGVVLFAVVALVSTLGASRRTGAGAGRAAAAEPAKKAAASRAEAGGMTGGAPAAEAPAPDAVFISYSRTDANFVLPVCDALKSQGKPLWLDQEGIDAGDSWAGEIVRAIRTVKGVAVMCSKAAFESDHVKREVYLADRYKKRLLPVLIDDTPMPDDFEYFFAGVQWLELHKTPEKDRPAAMARALAL